MAVCRVFWSRFDQVLMRFETLSSPSVFAVMILFKIAFGIGPGENGIFPMLLALILLLWPATAG